MSKQLKFEGKFKESECIRAYDFQPLSGRPDCFVEGVIERISEERGYKAFVIKCNKDVYCGEPQSGVHSRVGREVFIPMEVGSSDYDHRVFSVK